MYSPIEIHICRPPRAGCSGRAAAGEGVRRRTGAGGIDLTPQVLSTCPPFQGGLRVIVSIF